VLTDTERRDEDLLTPRQARTELPLSLAWFAKQRLIGNGPPWIRISGRVFYRRGELRSWIASQPRGGAHQPTAAAPGEAPERAVLPRPEPMWP
jgi:hypothetical protein